MHIKYIPLYYKTVKCWFRLQKYMKLCMYLAALRILFFSSTYAVDTSFYPDIDDVPNRPSSNTILYNRDIFLSSDNKVYTRIEFKEDERINNLVQIQQNICLDTIWPWDHWKNWYNYSCENQTLVRTAENWGWFWDRVSPTNDHGFCQLNYRRHKNFIDSPEFADQYRQLEYCNQVWMDAYKKWKMPRMAYSNRNAMKDRFLIQ